jgi:hypothetical protein
MKRILLLLMIFVAATTLKAQNIQTHYDLGKDRKYLTTTVEMFKPDKYGSTFFFIDMDYGVGGLTGVNMAYWEIARGLKFWKSPFEIHVEYNGGFGQFKATPYNGAYQINDAWLLGGSYTWNTKDFSKIFTLSTMYKNIRYKNSASFQVTGVWTVQLFKSKVTFDGFADFWREDNVVGPAGKSKNTSYVFLSEPQIWYNVCKKFAVGSEIELSNNFAGHDGFMVNPTIAAKFTL